MDILKGFINTILFLISTLFLVLLLTTVASYVLSIFKYEEVVKALELLKTFKLISWLFN